jgi:hypothetical protein
VSIYFYLRNSGIACAPTRTYHETLTSAVTTASQLGLILTR